MLLVHPHDRDQGADLSSPHGTPLQLTGTLQAATTGYPIAHGHRGRAQTTECEQARATTARSRPQMFVPWALIIMSRHVRHFLTRFSFFRFQSRISILPVIDCRFSARGCWHLKSQNRIFAGDACSVSRTQGEDPKILKRGPGSGQHLTRPNNLTR